MNTILTTPDVHLFVAAVRDHLADLSPEELEELTDGLEADLSDLVAERGVEALPAPATYAAELRAAAGLEARRPRRRPRRDAVARRLDHGTATWERWVADGSHLGLPALLESLRPVWWVVRGLCATALLVEVFSSQGVFGFTLRRSLVAALVVLVSVQVGRGRWWPGTRVARSVALRLVVVVLNVLALVLVPVMVSRFVAANNGPAESLGVETGFDPALATEGLFFGGRQVRNVYPYDAQGRPLTGVQLVDQDGRRLFVPQRHWDDLTEVETLLVPWRNGRTPLFSVFPLAEQRTDPRTGEPIGTARVQVPPFAQLPPVRMAGVEPSRVVTAQPDR
jgi:hypothetical protein